MKTRMLSRNTLLCFRAIANLIKTSKLIINLMKPTFSKFHDYQVDLSTTFCYSTNNSDGIEKILTVKLNSFED